MTALVLVLLVAVLVAAAVWVFRRQAIERERRRVDALTAVIVRLDASPASVRRRPLEAPKPSPRAPDRRDAVPGGRAALLDAVTEAVARVRTDGSRLAVALVAALDQEAATLADDVRVIVGSPTYAVGPHSVAVVLADAGRAEALGVLARVEVGCGAAGRAVELHPDEDAVALVARLFTEGSVPVRD